MRLLSLVCVPFFFVPVNPSRAEPTEETPAPAVVSPPAETTPPEPKPPLVVGHRARPSGCVPPLLPPRESLSLGRPTRGLLAAGRFLGESELVHHVDATDCNFWGTDELVGAMRRVAATVASVHPGHRLTVGELSRQKGGEIDGHASHESGRDVDLGFYFVDEEGQPYEPSRFVDVRRDRTAVVGERTLTFDVDRNWRLIEALLRDDEADVNFILVNGRIRDWLLAHARSIGAPTELYRHASRVLLRPRRGRHPHRNHYHVRIYCPATDSGCRDRGRLWAWVEQARAERAAQAASLEGAEAPDAEQGAVERARRTGERSAAAPSSPDPSRS